MSEQDDSIDWGDSDPEESTVILQKDKSHGHGQQSTASTAQARNLKRSTENHDARNRALQGELNKVRGVNNVVTKVILSLEKSRANMDTVHNSVRSASTLLDTWTRILSQTEHNQRLLLNPQWKGATQDVEDLENESMLRQQAADRKAAEEDMRREAAARAAEEEERKRAATPSGTRGARGRTRNAPAARIAPSARGGSSAPATTARRTTMAPGRAGSGIGRGISTARGRGRGV